MVIRAQSVGVSILLASLLAGAGCLGAGTAQLPEVEALRFDGLSLSVATTHDEPNEPVRALRIAWEGGLFAVEAELEGDLHPRSLVSEDAVFVSTLGLGWTRHPLSAVGSALSNRLLAWDLQRVLQAPGLSLHVARDGAATLLSGAGRITLGSQALDVEVWVRSEEGRVLEAHVASPQVRESPFTFRPAPGISFGLSVPAVARDAAEVGELDVRADDAHSSVLELLRAYVERRAGTVPDRIDQDALRLEMLASGATWPSSPFDAAPLQARFASGHLGWAKCDASDATYSGYGWDTILVSQSFGRGCSG